MFRYYIKKNCTDSIDLNKQFVLLDDCQLKTTNY